MQWLKSEGVTRALRLACEFGLWEELKKAINDAEPTNEQWQRWREAFSAKSDHDRDEAES